MTHFKYFGHLGNVGNPLAFFQEQNYIMCRGCTQPETLDRLLDFYMEKIVPSKRQYSRHSTYWEPNHLAPNGGVTNGFLNPHSYERGINGDFSDRILQVFSWKGIHEALREISDRPIYKLAQTLLFDVNVSTAHQDWIYLDSRPQGHLIGVKNSTILSRRKRSIVPLKTNFDR